MAFSPTSATATMAIAGGQRCYLWNFTTAEAAQHDEVQLKGAPVFGRIIRVQQSRTSGTAANHQPAIRIVSNGGADTAAGVDLKYRATSVAVGTDIDDPGNTGEPIPYAIESGSTLFYSLGLDSGTADTVAEVSVLVVEGLY